MAQSRARDRVALRAGAADARGRGGAGGGGAAGGRDGGRRARELRVPAAPRAHVLREGPVRHRRGVRRPLLARRDRAPGRALGAARRDGRGETAPRAADRSAAGQPRGGRRARRRTTAGRRPVRPPGTGKSTFAQAVPSRLGWPFVELFPSRLALEDGLANGLGRRFEEIAQLDHVLVFIDEVEEVAGARNLAAPVSVGVVNELLKSIVRFRDRDGRLLVCATNTVAALDPVPAARPLRLRPARRPARPRGPHRALGQLPRPDRRRGRHRPPGRRQRGVHARRHPAGRPDRRPGRLRAHPRHRHPRTPHHRGLPAHHQPHPAHGHHGDGVGVRGPHHPVRTYMRDRIRAYARDRTDSGGAGAGAHRQAGPRSRTTPLGGRR
nr:AAA family ATPase [Streptomyces cavourensis]